MHNSKLNKIISGKAYEGRSHFLYMRYVRLLNTNKYRSEIMIGYCFCGSFCTVSRSIKVLRTLVAEGNRILPIMNESVYTTDTRFGAAADTVRTVEELCGIRSRTVLRPYPGSASGFPYFAGILRC